VAFFVFILFSQSFASASFIIAFPAGDFSVGLLSRYFETIASSAFFSRTI